MPLGAIQNEVKERWRVDVNSSMMYRARTKANRQIFGKHELQYVKLWDYCETLRSTNPGSCVVLKVDRPVPEVNPKFLRMYCSLATMKKGFLEGCRPVIGVDGCFLKGPFKGQLLAVVGRDGNDNMNPIAYVVVEAETKDNWIWFLETLVSNLGHHERHSRPTFISDRQKGLMLAFEEVIPNVDHRICVRDLYANFRDIRGHQGMALKEKLWAATSTYIEGDFMSVMDELKNMNSDASEYLHKIDPSAWSRAWFTEDIKSDLLQNNISDYIDDFYSLEMYKKAYEPVLYPMPSEEQRIKTHHDMLEPPVARATPDTKVQEQIRSQHLQFVQGRQSERVKSIFWINASKPTIHIDLIESGLDSGAATIGGAATRGGHAVRGRAVTRGGAATRGGHAFRGGGTSGVAS
ncbi:uncharacterized protein LOC133879231 [Alnus glutinosa]|uniref:uncharacterized protein LOC133879231 n=1 Tax=Alnus glutinosa TaxID=3517 RepID=UPI002D76772B|nr:uncharacterized protein LOC133879231 [Alnus glutinosa]